MFPQNFTQLGKILQDRRSRQISCLVDSNIDLADLVDEHDDDLLDDSLVDDDLFDDDFVAPPLLAGLHLALILLASLHQTFASSSFQLTNFRFF